MTVAGLLTALLAFDPWPTRVPTAEVVAPDRGQAPPAPDGSPSASNRPTSPSREEPDEPSATTVVEATAPAATPADAAAAARAGAAVQSVAGEDDELAAATPAGAADAASARTRPGAVEETSAPTGGNDGSADATDIPVPPAVEGPTAGDGQAITSAGGATGASRVIVHFPASAAEKAREMEATFRAFGVANVTRLSAPFSISSTNVRYYRPEYRAAADAVARLAATHAADGTSVEARDFTAYRPRPSPGTIEVWLAGINDGTPPADPPPAAEAAAVNGREADGPSPRVAPAAATARLAEQERLENEVKSMLRTRLQGLQPD